MNINHKNKNLIILILFTHNNIFFNVTNLYGNTLLWNSVGFNKIKGLKKITLNSVKLNLTYINLIFNNSNFHIKFRGLSKHKKIVLKKLKDLNFKILTIYDETFLPHNGCKLKKVRRI